MGQYNHKLANLKYKPPQGQKEVTYECTHQQTDMFDYRNRNFRRHRNEDGSYTCIITVDGENVEVGEKIYNEYAKGAYKMERTEFGVKCDRALKDATGKAVKDANGDVITLPEREVSLDRLMDEEWDFPSSEPSPEDVLVASEEIWELRRCIALLTDDEQALINALFYKGMSERSYSSETGIPLMTINSRKHRIFGKLRKLMTAHPLKHAG